MDEVEKKDARKSGTFFELRDVIVIMVAVVSVSAAFFMYDTRISVLENQQHTMYAELNTLDALDDEVGQLRMELNALRERVTADSSELARIKELNRQLDKISDIQKERLEWARGQLDKIQARVRDLERRTP